MEWKIKVGDEKNHKIPKILRKKRIKMAENEAEECCSSGVEEVSGEHETGSTRISRKLEVCTDGERMEWW